MLESAVDMRNRLRLRRMRTQRKVAIHRGGMAIQIKVFREERVSNV